MLTFRRPAGSKAERKFIRRFLQPLGGKQDAAGNIIVRIGDAPVMWSCHTDTVHRTGGRQMLSTSNGWITAPKSSCLGADDGAGVWLMVNMIERKVPGLYVFHRAEEIGGYGSMHIAGQTKELLNGIDFAIALDRKGENSIVTHQWGDRCCSDDFAGALGWELGLGMTADPTGTFTDTANYTELVSECTNISVGYMKQHTAAECLNANYLNELLEALCSLDVRRLPVVRSPFSNADAYLDYNDNDPTADTTEFDKCWSKTSDRSYETLRDVVRNHPDAVADFLDSYGISAAEVMDHAGFSTVTYSHRQVS